jgi:UDP-N-acetylglucosamine 2-epimerase (non-hydrolysing)
MKNKIKVACFVGTRPEAIKMAPVVHELKRRSNEFETTLCSTGQHKEMLADALRDFELSPDVDLDVMQSGQTLAELSGRLFFAVDAFLEKNKPDWVLVQGDTTTVTVVSLCAFYRKIKIGHVEAGLRTHDKFAPFPEEINRRIAGLVADLHFVPTNLSRQNLLNEAVDEKTVIKTGNTVIDALLWMVDKVRQSPPVLPDSIETILNSGREYILVTGHRRENFGDGFLNICLAIRKLAEEFPEYCFIYPVHLNPNVQAPVNDILGNVKGVFLIPPQTYKPFIRLMDGAKLILTDSGGVQEEAPSLGKPVLVMRDVTERPEGIEAGACKLVGTDIDTIVGAVRDLLTSESHYKTMSEVVNPYGDGLAASRIIDALLENSKHIGDRL